MERFLFKKLELWQLILTVIIGFILLISYGAWIKKILAEGSNYGRAARIALEFAEIPSNLSKLVGPNPWIEMSEGHSSMFLPFKQRFKGKGGFFFAYPQASNSEAGYLLLSRYDRDRSSSVVELVDLNKQEIVHAWRPDFNILKKIGHFNDDVGYHISRFHPSAMRMHSPLLAFDGSLYFHDGSSIFRVNWCSQNIQTINGIFHHSLEFDWDGNIWTPGHIFPSSIPGTGSNFKDNSISKISREGRIIFEKSVAQILIDNGFAYLVYAAGRATDDPIHLNDVEPVKEDSKYWKKGDVFLSFRNLSMIVLYRPRTNKIVWHRQGPWNGQHDVDILDSSRISIFNNNIIETKSTFLVSGYNEVIEYDFKTDKLSKRYNDALSLNQVKTKTEGVAEILSNGDLFVEEQNYGRLLRTSKNGEVVWSFVNRASNGTIYVLNGSRMIDSKLGNQIVSQLAYQQCEGG
ncbi:MAG: hypothetical protein IPJ71_14435 [Bdellovibrionales bacterium]|nr:hypothetical protein [Bdellovibrionales bacterium]